MQVNRSNDTVEIDLVEVAKMLWKHVVAILMTGIVFAALLFSYARFFVTPQYEANALFYVNNSTFSLTDAIRVSTTELTAASNLVNTYVAILQSRANMEKVIAEAKVPYSYEQLRKMVSATAVNSTGLFRVTVRSGNPEETRVIANVIASVLPDMLSEIVFNSSVKVVDYAVTPRSRVSPSYTKYAGIGLLAGMVLAGAIFLMIEWFDDVIRDEEVLLAYDAPVLATIPDLLAKTSKKYGKYGKYGYGYGYGYEASLTEVKKNGPEQGKA